MTYDAVIVGAGPAGSTAAALLGQRRHRVLLVEKESFPRRKVCGAFLSGNAIPILKRLGVLQAVLAQGPESIAQGSIHLPADTSVSFRLPVPAIGISRLLLDELLARRAQEAGAEVRFRTRVVSIRRANGFFRIALAGAGRPRELEARTAIGAWGRWDALDRSLGRRFLRARRFLGWSRGYRGISERLAGQVRLYLFRGGYCGLSRVEAGEVNLAGVVSERVRQDLGAGWEAVLHHARRDNPALDADLAGLEPDPAGYLGTGPVFFTAKPPVEGGVLMVGDSAGVLDPFSGEGQSVALACGILAAETADAALTGAIPIDRLARSYASAWKHEFAHRFGWSAVFRRLMLHPRLASTAARLAGDKLTSLALRRLDSRELAGNESSAL